MATGTIKWYDGEKGFGFIAQENGGDDLFVHHSVVNGEVLAEGDKVEFTIGQGAKGARAESLRVISRSGNAPRARRTSYDDGDRSYGGGSYGDRSYGSGGGRDYGFDRSPRFTQVDASTLPSRTGVVRNFDRLKGFGFITQDQGGDDVFFHQSVIDGEAPRSGDRVEFKLGQGAKGPRAERVQTAHESR